MESTGAPQVSAAMPQCKQSKGKATDRQTGKGLAAIWRMLSASAAAPP
jgi:hypothetical protein